MEKQFFYELVDRYMAGTATTEEMRMVEFWYAQLTEGSTKLSTQEKERLDTIMLQSILERTQAKLPSQPHTQPRPKVVPLYRKPWFRYAAASVIVLILGTSGWLMLKDLSNTQDLAALPREQRFKNDIAPASQGVTLNPGNDKKIRLDSLLNGTLSLDDSVIIQKKDDQLTYGPGAEHVSFHTIATGKGKNYNLVLADGTKVWLDAESSLYFPTAFPGQERTVKVTGQAYFEVAKDRFKPFRVKFQDQVVEVLGTHFNINAHEIVARTTLLEGSVRISNTASQSRILAPGQQASLLPNGQWMMTADANIDEVMAWKNGLFRFNGASIKDIMVQLERWYDIKVDYANNINDVSLVARINRNENISTILSLLEMTGQVRFAIDGNKVTVINSKSAGS
jgi:hypothetical protein